MELKQMLIVILIITLSFTVLIVGVMALVVYKPEVVGFGNKPPKTVRIDTLKNGSLAYNKSGQKSRYGKNGAGKPSNQAGSQSTPKEKMLLDSIAKINRFYAGSRDALDKMRDSLGRSAKSFAALKDSLVKLTAMYIKASKTLKSNQSLLTGQNKPNAQTDKIKDSLKVTNLKRFATIYDNSSPQAVAQILERISSRDAASILKLMQKKKAGKVLEVISPEQAAAILISGQH